MKGRPQVQLHLMRLQNTRFLEVSIFNEDVLNRHHEDMGKDKQHEEINRRLEILKSKTIKQNQRDQIFNRSGGDQDHNISPEPADIDNETHSHDRSEFSNRQNVYSEIGNFERKFNS